MQGNGTDRQTDTQTDRSITLVVIKQSVIGSKFGLQCFDAVGWAAGRASGL